MPRRFAKKQTKPVIRKDHASESRRIMASVASANANPPNPLPALARPPAKLRRRWNHCGSTCTLGMKSAPKPVPTAAPWERQRCQGEVAKEAAIWGDVEVSSIHPFDWVDGIDWDEWRCDGWNLPAKNLDSLRAARQIL